MEETKHVHTHSLPDGTVIEHVHEDAGAEGHGHSHSHTHTHTHTKAVLNRLSRAIGHLESIRRMVEDKLAMALVERGEGAISGVALSVQDGELRQEVL